MGVAKCNGEDCKLKEKCYRYTKEPHPYWQTYIAPTEQGEDCEYFDSNEETT